MNHSRPRLLIVGSLNMDLVVQTALWPQPGQTVAGTQFQTIPGGKGANQAVAAARLGGQVSLLGRLGDDVFGESLSQHLAEEGLSLEGVQRTEHCETGVAVITVQGGENTIVVVPGANGRLQPDDIQQHASRFQDVACVLLQNEIPLETSAAAIRLARQHGAKVIWDPAPAPQAELPDEFWRVDLITPNQSELAELTGKPTQTLEEARRAADLFHQKGVPIVVLKLGAQGALWLEQDAPPVFQPAFPIKAIDSTAAGDAFTAALAVKWAERAAISEILAFACAAGGLAATRLGAQSSLPTRYDVEQFLRAVALRSESNRG